MINKRIFIYIWVIVVFLGGKPVFSQEFELGVDLSYANELNDCGAVFYDSEGTEKDVYRIFSEKGATQVRLRLWHDPQWTEYSNFTDVKRSSSRAADENMSVMLDLHYSDFWADPGRQWRPAAWNGLSDELLGDSVFQYTYDILAKLSAADLLPSIVQIGNEINGNILLERTTQDIDDSSPGMFPINWSRQVSLLHKGIEAVQQINTDSGANMKTLIHIAQPENAIWWFDDAVSKGLEGFDIIGLSYYPQWSDLDPREVGEYIDFLIREYDKEVMIVETGYPWTQTGDDNAGNVLGRDSKLEIYEDKITVETQRDLMIELAYLTTANGGSGIVYWEPAWVSSDCSTYWGTGSHYENAALFDYDHQMHEGADFLSYDYAQIPPGLSDQDVTFIVDMTGVEIGDAVYITGDMTGDTWVFEPMEAIEENKYEYTIGIPGRSAGAYIFYTDDIWNDQYREEVPAACAEMWDTHRKYVIVDRPETYEFAWNSCSTSAIDEQNRTSDFGIIVKQGADYLDIESRDVIDAAYISNIHGQILMERRNAKGSIDISHLPASFYILTLKTSNKTSSFKFIKQ